MGEIRRVAKSIGTTALMMDALETEVVSAGWTLHDDQWDGSSGYLVFSSMGNAARRAPQTCYLKITKATNYIYFERYGYWNNSTQTGTLKIGLTSAQCVTDDDSPFYYWLYGNEDYLIFLTKVGANYDLIYVGRYTPLTNGVGIVSSAATSGSSVTVSLRSGHAQNFFPGSIVSVYDAQSSSWNGRDYRAVIDAVDYQNDTIEINTLNISLSVGAVVSYVQDFWITFNDSLQAWMLGNEAYTATGTGTNVSATDNIVALYADTYMDPDYMVTQGATPSNFWSLNPYRIPRQNTGTQGILDRAYLQCSDNINTLNYEDMVPVGLRADENQATSGGSSTITDTGESWTTNEWAGKVVMITQGTGAGQIREIASNTATEITVTEAWSTAPDSTSYYVICDEGWRYFGWGNASYSAAVHEQPAFQNFTSYLVTTTTTTTTTTTA
jgi:hypothetical protein